MAQNKRKLILCEIVNSTKLDTLLSHTFENYESDDDFDLVCALPSLLKRKRMCIENYLEQVVTQYNDKEFKTHFRISRNLFKSLVDRFQNSTDFTTLRMGERSISPSAHIAVFLWFAGHEACSFRDLADRFNLSLSSISRVINRMIYFFSNMSPEVIKWPSIAKKAATCQYFKNICKFEKVIGCLDGTRIMIDPPVDRKDDYIDRKGNVTLSLQAICDEKKKCISIFVGHPGSCHDSWILQNSPSYGQLTSKCGEYYLLADSAYPCTQHIITPYKDNGHLTSAQRNFNKKLGSGRVYIEHTFGILKQRFRQLYYCKLRGIEKLCHFIRACCVLHNMANENDLDFLFQEEYELDDDPHYYESSLRTNNIRDSICREVQM